MSAGTPQQVAESPDRSVRVQFPAQVEFAGERFAIEEFTANLSDSGMFLPTDHAVPVGTTGKVTFRVSQWDDPFTIQAEVVRIASPAEATFERKAGLGIRFLELSALDRKRLQRLIDGFRDGSVVQAIRRAIQESGKGLDQELRRRPTGHKLILAVFASGEEIDALIRHGNPSVLSRMITNPRLRVPHIRALLRNARLPVTLLRDIKRKHEWMRDDEVRFLYSKHPNTPLQESLQMIPQLPLSRIQQLAADQYLKPQIRALVKKLVRERRR